MKFVMLILVIGANFVWGGATATNKENVEIFFTDGALISFENIQGERLLVRVLDGVGVHVSGANFDPIRKDLTKDEFEDLIQALYEVCTEWNGNYLDDEYTTQVYLSVEKGDEMPTIFIRQKTFRRNPEMVQIFRLIERMEQILEIEDCRLVEAAEGLLQRGDNLETR